MEELKGKRDVEDEAILNALAEGLSYREAAELSRTSERTVRRRMADPEFRARSLAKYSERQRLRLARLDALGEKVMAVLEDSLGSTDEGARLKAVRLINDMSGAARAEMMKLHADGAYGLIEIA